MHSLSNKIPRHESGTPVSWGNVAVFTTMLFIVAIGFANSRNDILTSFRHLDLTEIFKPAPHRGPRPAATEEEAQTAVAINRLPATLEHIAAAEESASVSAVQPVSQNLTEELTPSAPASVIEEITPTTITPMIAQTESPTPATAVAEKTEPESITEKAVESVSFEGAQTALEKTPAPSDPSNWSDSIIVASQTKAIKLIPADSSEEERRESPLMEQITVPAQVEETIETEVAIVEEATEITKIDDINRLEPPAAARPEVAIRDAIMAWADAWSNQDANAYLDRYAADFTPPRKMSRRDWEKQRRERLQRPASIDVELSDMEITLTEEGNANATFTQDYRSPRYSDQVRKRLNLVQEMDGWKIIREESL